MDLQRRAEAIPGLILIGIVVTLIAAVARCAGGAPQKKAAAPKLSFTAKAKDEAREAAGDEKFRALCAAAVELDAAITAAEGTTLQKEQARASAKKAFCQKWTGASITVRLTVVDVSSGDRQFWITFAPPEPELGGPKFPAKRAFNLSAKDASAVKPGSSWIVTGTARLEDRGGDWWCFWNGPYLKLFLDKPTFRIEPPAATE